MLIIETTRGPFQLSEVYYVQRIEDVHNLKKDLRPNRIVYVRQALVPLELGRLGAWYRPFPTVLIDLSRDLSELFREASRTCRNRISRINRLSARTMIRRNDSSAYSDFLKLHNSFVSRSKYSEPLSRARLDQLRSCVDVFVAYFDGRPMCGHVLLRDESIGRVELLFSASTRLEEKEDARVVSWINRWLHWYEIRLFKAERMLLYDLGGAATDTSHTAGIARFKQSFGGTRVVEHSYIAAGAIGKLAISAFYAIRRIRYARSIFSVAGLFADSGWTDIAKAPLIRDSGSPSSTLEVS